MTQPAPRASVGAPTDVLEALLTSSAQAMLVTDGAGRILHANPRSAALLERAPEELEGRLLTEIVRPGDALALAEGIRHSFAPGSGAPDLEATVVHPRGLRGLVSLTFLPFETAQGRRLVLLLRDLTVERSLRDTASAAERAQERAEAAELRKLADLGRITSGIVHEVKTPLTYVNNNIALQLQIIEGLQRARPELASELEALRDVTQSAQHGADRITRLLHDLRPLAQNKLQRRTPADLASIVTDAVKVFRGTHRGAVTFSLDLESTHPVLVDRDEMCQVLLNLFSNAAHAMGDEGEIHVATRNQDTPPEIRVRDQGPGVPSDLVASLFQPFRTSKKDGTGLGLFISRRIVESHGGTLVYEVPEDGPGACFVIRLPESR